MMHPCLVMLLLHPGAVSEISCVAAELVGGLQGRLHGPSQGRGLEIPQVWLHDHRANEGSPAADMAADMPARSSRGRRGRQVAALADTGCHSRLLDSS